jgi:hypothetical protein
VAERGADRAQGDDAPDHLAGELLGVRARRLQPRDDRAVAHDRHAVGRLQDLVELVADEDDRPVLLPHHPAQHVEQLDRLRGREHRRRLVEDEDVGLAHEALHDLDSLPLAGREIVDARTRVDVEAVALRRRADAADRRGRVDAPPFAEGHVLPHRQRADEAEVLVHHRETEPGRFGGIVDHDRAAVDQDLPGVGHDQPEHHVHQRRLAGAVLAEHTVDLAASHREVDVVARDDGAEPLGDGSELDRRNGHPVATPSARSRCSRRGRSRCRC